MTVQDSNLPLTPGYADLRMETQPNARTALAKKYAGATAGVFAILGLPAAMFVRFSLASNLDLSQRIVLTLGSLVLIAIVMLVGTRGFLGALLIGAVGTVILAGIAGVSPNTMLSFVFNLWTIPMLVVGALAGAGVGAVLGYGIGWMVGAIRMGRC